MVSLGLCACLAGALGCGEGAAPLVAQLGQRRKCACSRAVGAGPARADCQRVRPLAAQPACAGGVGPPTVEFAP